MTFTLANIKAAGSRVTEYHAPFKAEGTDIRNAFGVIVGAGIDEVHANAFAAAGNMRPALEAAEYWIEEQAWSPIAENGEILRTIRDALGKPHDAPDAAPSAPQTPSPVVGPHHGPELSEQLRLARALIGTDDTQGRHEARACIDRAAHVSALMLAALRLAAERIEMNNYGGEEDEALAEINAAIAAAEAGA